MTDYHNPKWLDPGSTRKDLLEYREYALDTMRRVEDELKRFVYGIDDDMDNLARCPFTSIPYMAEDRFDLGCGHVLLEGPPGTAKTVSAKVLAESIQARFAFDGGNPDKRVSDYVGGQLMNPQTGECYFAPGPLIESSIILLDEINRNTPKTQSCLLPALEDRRVPVTMINSALKKAVNFVAKLVPVEYNPNRFKLAQDNSKELVHFAVATSNQIELAGTYPMSEALLERFTYCFPLHYPEREGEKKIRPTNVWNLRENKALKVNKITTLRDIWLIMRFIPTFMKPIPETPVTHELMQRILENSRPLMPKEKRPFATDDLIYLVDKYVKYGVSPRANHHWASAATTLAFARGSEWVTPDDVKNVAPLVLSHRIQLKVYAKAQQIPVTARSLLDEIIRLTPCS